LLSADAHIEFDTRHKSADDFKGYTTTSILSSHFHRTSVTSVPCFIRACDGCCTNVFIRLNSRASKVSRDRRVVTRGSGRAKGGREAEANGNTSEVRGSWMKRIALGLCARFLAWRRTCSHISNRVLSSPLRHGPLLTLPSANSLTYADTYVYPRLRPFYMNTNVPCPCGQTHLDIVRYVLGIESVNFNLVNRYIT